MKCQFKNLYGGQLTSLTQSIKLNYLVIHPSRHSFTVSVENVPPLLDMTYLLTYFSGEDGGPQARKDEGSSTGAILGGVIGGVCAVLLFIVVVLIIRRKNKKKKDPAQPLPAVQYCVVVCSYT